MSRQATATPPPWRVLELGLNPTNLRQRIQQRTEQLYRDGLVEETRRLSERYGADLPLLQTIGYGEALQVIGGSLSTADAVRSPANEPASSPNANAPGSGVSTTPIGWPTRQR